MTDDLPPSTMVRATGEEPQRRGPSFTEILNGIAHDPARERISVDDLLVAMGDRALAALMLVFALPNVLPTPPGTSGILGVPLVILAAQLMLGKKPWLPRFVARRSMRRQDLAAFVDRASPWLERVEKLLHPRLEKLVQPPFEYLIGAVCLLLAAILLLPIPLGNMLPAFSICILSFAIIGKDGIWAIIGILSAILSVALVGGVVYALAKGAIFIIVNIFN